MTQHAFGFETPSYMLVLGNKNYSSWSMRAWLLLRHAGVSFDETCVDLYEPNSRDQVRSLGGETGLVPVLVAEGFPIWDTLAIAEYLYEKFPQIWPAKSRDRARARSYCGELHAGFDALRQAMPVNARARNRFAKRTPDVLADIARVAQIWARAGRGSGPWLFDRFCAADIMFAPVALRFQTYAVAVGAEAEPYYRALLSHPLVVEWQTLGQSEPKMIERFELPSIDEVDAPAG